MFKTTKDFKLKFLGVVPKTKKLSPQKIVGLSAILTYKGLSLDAIYQKLKKKGENIDKKIQFLLRESSLRGHASLATTPVFCFQFEGSKFLDSALTGLVFSSSLMASGRRINTRFDDVISPEEIYQKKEAKKIYEKTLKDLISFFDYLLDKGVKKDEASKILPYGIYGTGIIQMSVESTISLKKEYEKEKDWMPEEVGILLKKIEEISKKEGFNWLYATRICAPKEIYPFPNIFKDPKKENIVRALRKKNLKSKIISFEANFTKDFIKRIKSYLKKRKEIFKSLEKIKKEWVFLLREREDIVRDYNLAFKIKILSSVPWRVWGEKKRHRTCPMIVESIYFCIERTKDVFLKYKKQIEKEKISKKTLEEIEDVFDLPPTIKKFFLFSYLKTSLKSFENYQKLKNLGIKEKSSLFLIPRALKIDVLQEYDLYNLLCGYFPLRACSKAEEFLQRTTWQEINLIKKEFEKRKIKALSELLGPKCFLLGFCPEKNWCPLIKKVNKNYNHHFHQEMFKTLENFYEKFLETI